MPPPKRPTPGQRKIDKNFLVDMWDWIKTGELSGDRQTTLVNRIWGTGTTVKAKVPQSVNQGGNGSSNEYNGYFKVIDASTKSGEVTTYKVKVVNGADTASANAGYYQHGLSDIAVPVSNEFTITASGYVYVTITNDGANYVFTFAFATSVPTSTQGHIVRKIAKITVTSGTMTISQTQTGNLITAGVL